LKTNVKYHVQKVDELPPGKDPRQRARFDTLLRPLLRDQGSWYLVATYRTATAAGVAKRNLEGKENILDALWEFEVRAVEDPEGNQEGQLYARCTGKS
jgi:hypothetical protein